MGAVSETPWMAIIAILTCLGTGIWSLIKMYFQGKEHDARMKEYDVKMAEMEASFKQLDKDICEDIKIHKEAMEKKVSQIYVEIKSSRDILIEVQTMCKLLISNKIKPD